MTTIRLILLTTTTLLWSPTTFATAGAAATTPPGVASAGRVAQAAQPEVNAAPLAPSAQPTAQAPSAALKPAPAAVTQLPPQVEAALKVWTKAVEATPRLVSLVNTPQKGAALSPSNKLKARLQVLGDKTFSNREWKHYWEQQGKTAGALAASVERAKLNGAWSKALREWEALANAKIINQDAYLTAIERERDAIEERLEALLERDEKKPEAKRGSSTEDPSPFEARKALLTDLKRRIDQQGVKKHQGRSELKLIEGQLEVEKILLKALHRDVELAERELQACQAAAGLVGMPGHPVWQRLAGRGDQKVRALSKEARFEAARERGRRVEAGLVRSQIKFRDDRIQQLQRDMDRVSGFSSWLNAVADTFVEWLLKRAWRILIGLLVVYALASLALRLISTTAAEWRRKAEGDPDDTKDDDQRTLTLITVFSGVLRIAVYVVGGLVALEQVGIDTGPLLGSVAILGLAVSFGSQNLVRDVVNGLFVLLENQYAVGDVVEISGKTGAVERITIRSTWIRQANGDLHAVPNGSITTVTNMTRDWSRAVVPIGVGYDADLAEVETVCKQVAEELFADEKWQGSLMAAPEWGGVVELGDSAVTVRLLAKTHPGDQWSVTRELNRRLKVALDAAGIDIPFPQRVVWTKTAQ